MSNKYGPNFLKVDAFIKAIKEMSAEAFSLTGPRTMDWERLESLMRTTSQENERLTESAKAYLDVEEAVRDKGSETQTKVIANVAAMLVIEDRLTREERTFLSLFLVHPFVPLNVLYEDFKKEDRAVEDFCEQLSLIDGQIAYVKSRPDERGQTGVGLPDFIINRAGRDFTVEHTSLDTYPNQVFFEKLWAKYFRPLKIEEKIKQTYPKDFIHIYIPVDVFRRESEAKKFDFDKFLRDLVDAVGKTPKGKYQRSKKTHNIPFPVDISNDDGDGFVGCYVVQVVPTHEKQMEAELEKEVLKAIKKKHKKLQQAKDRGENTIFLLDSDDYALVNERILADAFARAAGTVCSLLDAIDEVYIQHRRGNSWLVPVKIADHVYPNLSAFEDYLHKQFQTL